MNCKKQNLCKKNQKITHNKHSHRNVKTSKISKLNPKKTNKNQGGLILLPNKGEVEKKRTSRKEPNRNLKFGT